MSTLECSGVSACEADGWASAIDSAESTTRFLDAARGLARRILACRLRARDGAPTWRRPERSSTPELPLLVPAGPHLYDGLTGIAIFLAALARIDGDRELRHLGGEVVEPLRRLLERLVEEPERARALRLGIGGLTGLGSFVYALVTLGRLREEPDLVDAAHRVAILITPERIAADDRLDVVSGSSGTILALLALDRHRPGATLNGARPLELAELCADRLLASRIELGGGASCWRTNPAYPPLNGFAHGAAGICSALLRLHARTGRTELAEAAWQGWAFERTTFSPRHGNWRDARTPEPGFQNGWCYGAPGIALGRLSTLHVAADDAVRREIACGLEATRDPRPSRFDHLCCGDMGRVDVLLYAYDRLGEPWLLAAAIELAERVLDRAERRGRFAQMVPVDDFDPSCFAGAAGIGYALLRLVRPAELPCLLSLE